MKGRAAFTRQTVSRVISRIASMNAGPLVDLYHMRFHIRGPVGAEVRFEMRFRYITAGPFIDNDTVEEGKALPLSPAPADLEAGMRFARKND